MNVWGTNLWLAVLVVAVVAASATSQERTNDQAEVLLQAAKHKALVDGDLKEAIKLCEKIVAEHASDRSTVAKPPARSVSNGAFGT